MAEEFIHSLPRFASEDCSPPSSYAIKPQTLVLDGQQVVAETEANTPLYRTSRLVTKIQQQPSSIHLERVGSLGGEWKSAGDSTQQNGQNQLLFYLVHPVNSSYRENVPNYFATGTSPQGLGNLILNIQKRKLQKPEYRITLSKGRSATSQPLFHAEEDIVLFTAKPKTMGKRLIWKDETGKPVATEDVKVGKSPRLQITKRLDIATRDALVAVWCLRVWSDVAESRESKQDGKRDMNEQNLLRIYLSNVC